MMPTVAAVIPTRNRLEDLRVAVRTVLAQNRLPQQLVIVDQSERGDGRAAIEAEYQLAGECARRTVALEYVYDPAIPGLTAARNAGLRRVTTELAMFLDDDVELQPDYVAELMRAFERFPDAAALSGTVVNYPLPPAPLRLWLKIFARGVFHDDRQPVYWNARRLRERDEVIWVRRLGGLMCVRVELARKTGFDEKLRGVCDGEDVDFSVRLGPAARLGIVPRAALLHNHSPAGRARDHWLSRFFRGELYLYYKHWNRGLRNRACCAWLFGGCALVLLAACARRQSIEPFRTARQNLIRARQLARQSAE